MAEVKNSFFRSIQMKERQLSANYNHFLSVYDNINIDFYDTILYEANSVYVEANQILTELSCRKRSMKMTLEKEQKYLDMEKYVAYVNATVYEKCFQRFNAEKTNGFSEAEIATLQNTEIGRILLSK